MVKRQPMKGNGGIKGGKGVKWRVNVCVENVKSGGSRAKIYDVMSQSYIIIFVETEHHVTVLLLFLVVC